MDDEFSAIRNNGQIKEVFEALLIDSTTPEEVFVELFGVKMEQVTAYKSKYEGAWGRPRMFTYAYISDVLKGSAKTLSMKVFNGGWSVLDALFNSGKNINTADAAMRILRVMAGKSGMEAVEGSSINTRLLAAAKSMVSAAHQYNQIEGGDTDDAWEFMINELAERERKGRIPDSVLEAYRQVEKALAGKGNKEGEND